MIASNDDAIGRVRLARFVEGETTAAMMQAMRTYVERHERMYKRCRVRSNWLAGVPQRITRGIVAQDVVMPRRLRRELVAGDGSWRSLRYRRTTVTFI